jgi:hypothetical protein
MRELLLISKMITRDMKLTSDKQYIYLQARRLSQGNKLGYKDNQDTRRCSCIQDSKFPLSQ